MYVCITEKNQKIKPLEIYALESVDFYSQNAEL
jgi:hypothetical protein